MIAFQKGDREAGRDLLGAARVIAAVHATRILGPNGIKDRSIIEDVVQETLLAVFEKRHTYDPSLPFIPWLTAVTRYKTVDRMRRSQWNKTESLEITNLETEAQLVDPTIMIELDRLLSTLPERARRAVELVKLEGFTHAEAAEKLGVGEGAIKVLVHRAIKRMRDTFVSPSQSIEEEEV